MRQTVQQSGLHSPDLSRSSAGFTVAKLTSSKTEDRQNKHDGWSAAASEHPARSVRLTTFAPCKKVRRFFFNPFRNYTEEEEEVFIVTIQCAKHLNYQHSPQQDKYTEMVKSSGLLSEIKQNKFKRLIWRGPLGWLKINCTSLSILSY